ncbi:MAG TPA: type II toxin-antitoxin system Phd/YefM family antitoxin [Streptomyces sp.]|jgi:prevent-host-death family protein
MSELPVESIRNVREHLADVVDRADRDETPTYITRRGKKVAAIVPIEFVDAYYAAMRRDLEQFAATNPSDDPSSLTALITETLDRPA